MGICSIGDCNGEGKITRGLCNKHYRKQMFYGDPLAGYELKNLRGEGNIGDHGYRRIGANGKSRKEHQLIIEKALGRPIPAGAECHHVDGSRANNVNSNLVCATPMLTICF